MGKTIRMRTGSKKPTITFKFNIDERRGMLPQSITTQDLLDYLDVNGISRDEYYYDRKIQTGSDKSPTVDRLLIYSKVFGCSLDDLINYKIDVKSIYDKLPKLARVKVKHGLR